MMTIFLAGYETPAKALTWTVYLLTLNPEADTRMSTEVREVLGEGDGARPPTLDDYPRLRYTAMVLAEGMRLYPPAWAMGRMNIEPMEIGGYRLPPGTHWYLSQDVLQRDAELDPDPLRFEPMRHTDEEKGKAGQARVLPVRRWRPAVCW